MTGACFVPESPAPAGLCLLAAADGATGWSLLNAVGWILLLIIFSVVIFVVYLWAKNRFLDGGTITSTDAYAGGFTVSDLRRMRDSGKISDEEFERARERIVSAAKRRMEEEVAAQGDPDRPPVDAPRTKDVDLIREAES